jgi:hypothetical protein
MQKPPEVEVALRKIRKSDPHREGDPYWTSRKERALGWLGTHQPREPEDDLSVYTRWTNAFTEIQSEHRARLWQVMDCCIYDAATTDLVDREIKVQQSYGPTRTGHDICGYCGEDNGPHGERRVGWDCCYCGGN